MQWPRIVDNIVNICLCIDPYIIENTINILLEVGNRVDIAHNEDSEGLMSAIDENGKHEYNNMVIGPSHIIRSWLTYGCNLIILMLYLGSSSTALIQLSWYHQ